jgi:transcriptional regulator with XRE-family HTH domain
LVNDWRSELRQARERLGLSQAKVARLAGLSAETVRAYERGRRRPSHDALTAILDAFKVDRGLRNEILNGAGFASDGLSLRPGYAELMYTAEEAAREAETRPWPSFVMNEVSEVVVANQVAQTLWDVDLRAEFTDAIERNLLCVSSDPRFADRCANWDEAVAIIVAGLKGHMRDPADTDHPTPYFAAVLERFLKGDPRYVRRFLDLWERTPPMRVKIHWTYPVVWHEPGYVQMRFHCLVSTASEPDGLAFNDWIPLDAQSWTALEQVKARRRH